MEETTIDAELIGFHDTNHVPMYQTIKDIWAYTATVDRNPADLWEFEKINNYSFDDDSDDE